MRRSSFSRRRLGFATRSLALGMALVAILGVRSAIGDPTDIFNQAAPLATDAPPQATPTLAGDESVSPTGSLEYSYPIDVPPGRHGMQPRVSLHYSSTAAIYGGLAAGWSLEGVPAVMLDTRAGRLKSPYYSPTLKIYKTSPGEQQLVPVSETTSDGATAFRAIHDGSFTRYELMPSDSRFKWRAYATDGQTMYFGDTDHALCQITSDEYAPLTRVVDAFGNAIEYFYGPSAVDGECRIQSISWGQNSAGLGSFALISFAYNDPPPICAGVAVGSQSSYRTGTKIVTGASELNQIVITAFAPDSQSVEHTRTITLGYDAATSSCTAQHAAYRSLTTIQESAWGVDSPRVDLPAITFTYGSATNPYVAATPSLPWPAFFGPYDGLQSYNLAWGRRFPTAQPTVEATLVDIDGDGLLDRLTNAPVRVDGHVVSCRAAWERNRGPGYTTFDSPRYIDMPTLKWTNRDDAHPYAGGPYASDDTDTADRCALNFQQTSYVNSHYDGSPFCPNPDGSNAGCPVSGICPNKTDCDARLNSHPPTILSYRWIDLDGDGLVDLVASPTKGGLNTYNFVQGNGIVKNPEGLIPAPPEPELFGPVSSYPPCPTNTSTAWAGQQYTMCGHMFPYFVYKNHGNGAFGTHLPTFPPTLIPDTILWQPVALEPDAGDSAFMSTPIGSQQGTLDLDGDGYIDGVFKDFTYPRWDVWRNDQTGNPIVPRGQFTASPTAPPFGGPFLFFTAPDSFLNLTSIDVDNSGPPIQAAGLVDVNGDGLVDRWTGSGTWSTDPPYTIDINDGLQFRVGEISSSVRPGTDVFPLIDSQNHGFVFSGRRIDPGRLLDIDGDGRADAASYSGVWSTDTVSCPDGNPPPTPTVYFNQGGQFGDAAVAPTDNRGFTHLIVASEPFQGNVSYAWELRSDLVDLDGDGIPEGIYFHTGCTNGQPSGLTIAAATPTDPPRLLVRIDNASGATTTVSYASMANDTVVEQHPELGKTMPRTRWVVRNVTTRDNFANAAPTDSTTAYKYVSPRWLPDDEGIYALRGFDEIDKTLPSGAVHVERYSFSPDFGGRLVQTIVHPAEAPSDSRTIDSTTWEARTLFDSKITTYHATVQEHLTCKNGQSEVTCNPGTAAAYTRTSVTLSACGSTAQGSSCDASTQPSSDSLLWLATRSLLSLDPNGNALDGDRETLITYAVYAGATNYRVRTLTSTNNNRSGGVMTTFAKTAHTWDPQFLVPLTDEQWFDADDANRAITRRVYDMTTGNVLERWKPVQNAANTTRLVNTYDSRKLFVATDVDEKGLTRDYTYEYGTGTKLLTDGPNVRSCTQNCPNDALHPVKETHKIRVDGLGRTIERWDTLSDDGGIYTLYELATTSYVDTAVVPTTPTSVSTQHLITYDSTAQTQEKTETDGHGRPIRKTVYVQGSAPADQITSFHYRNDGTLADVTIPDPTANNSSTVTYTYSFDSVGRPTSIRRPDSAMPSNQSGIDLTYDGVTKTATEVVGGAGGQIAVTQTKTDSFGRLIEVDEYVSASPDVWSTTTYQYGPDDNVSAIVDPENGELGLGGTTYLYHDFAGHRTEIARGDRAWRYTYDKNGNMVSEQVPGSGDPMHDVDFTTTIAYDDLDRPVSRVIGQRNLSPADQQLFAADHEVFSWDYVGLNRKGRLTFWQTYAPGQSNNNYALAQTFGYDGLGHRWLNEQTLKVASLPALTRGTYEYANLFGAPWRTRYFDDVAGTNETQSRIIFDPRGLPQKIYLTRTGEPAMYVAVQTRNVAGLVTKRHTDVSGGAMTFVESNWTYDKLGRVASQVVQQGPGPTQVARQDLTYFGNDDPATLDDWLGLTNHKQFHYTFDLRHQLVGVSETAQGGVFGATYAYGKAGRFMAAQETAAALPGSDVKPRSVVYNYGNGDFERVTSLTNAADGTTYAGYTYDDAGNQTSRTYPATGESWDYVYDGNDRLRRATKKLAGVVQGSEEYWYDSAGNRTSIVKRDAVGNKTEMIWFLSDTESHYDGAGNLVHVYSHLSLGTPVARVDRTGNTATSLEFQFHGLSNNTLAAVDQGGTINASFSYAPFSEVVEATDGGAGVGAGVLAHRRRLNDKYLDEISNLTHYGARFYDPILVGWTQADPLYRFSPDESPAKPRVSHLYTFSRNNPLRYIDPDGRTSVAGVLGALVDVGEAVSGAFATATEVVAAANPVVAGVLVGVVLARAASTDIPDRYKGDGCGSHCTAPPGEGSGGDQPTPGHSEPLPGGPHRQPGDPGDYPKSPWKPARPPIPTPGPQAPPPTQPRKLPPGAPGNPTSEPIDPANAPDLPSPKKTPPATPTPAPARPKKKPDPQPQGPGQGSDAPQPDKQGEAEKPQTPE